MERAIRVECFQDLVNYRKPSSFIIKESYPLPPYSTVLGMIHAVCGYKEFHPMGISVQGRNAGSVSELYTRYSFAEGKYEKDRVQNYCFYTENGKEKTGIYKGIAHVELICNNEMILHIMPAEDDFDTVYRALMNPLVYPALGRYEDILDIRNVEVVEIHEEEEVISANDIYLPLSPSVSIGNSQYTIYTLTKEYEITPQGLRRWKTEGGKIKAYYFPRHGILANALTDSHGDMVAFA